ncbi:MAG: hypothetical protein BWY06_01047 [Candidatus Latescibacteria bacterium ADurb.Bin168]|nr:MAG: hypothetical protein BWY06_01047 [Candidatus Latescibacteria bacterium ADurb.Bin168]
MQFDGALEPAARLTNKGPHAGNSRSQTRERPGCRTFRAAGTLPVNREILKVRVLEKPCPVGGASRFQVLFDSCARRRACFRWWPYRGHFVFTCGRRRCRGYFPDLRGFPENGTQRFDRKKPPPEKYATSKMRSGGCFTFNPEARTNHAPEKTHTKCGASSPFLRAPHLTPDTDSDAHWHQSGGRNDEKKEQGRCDKNAEKYPPQRSCPLASAMRFLLRSSTPATR